MLDQNINNHFKVLNDPTLIGCNPTMSIQLILAQFEALYGKPGDQWMWNKDKVFPANFLPNDAPELMFIALNSAHTYAVDYKHCASPSTVRDVPDEKVQGLEATSNKTWRTLKTFIHGA